VVGIESSTVIPQSSVPEEVEDVVLSMEFSTSKIKKAVVVSKRYSHQLEFRLENQTGVSMRFPSNSGQNSNKFHYNEYFCPSGLNPGLGQDTKYIWFQQDGKEYCLFDEFIESKSNQFVCGLQIVNISTGEKELFIGNRSSLLSNTSIITSDYSETVIFGEEYEIDIN
jgi:hypothetical protein